jgi:hypothetical protein
VDYRCSGLHRLLHVEDRREHLVVDLDAAAAFFGSSLAIGHHGRHPLPDEPHNVVEHVCIVGIDKVVVVDGGGIQAPGHILPGEDIVDARCSQGGLFADSDDAGVGVR